MVSLFGSKTLHPLADDSERVALLSALLAAQPGDGLQQATEILRAVMAGAEDMSLPQREAIIGQVDVIGQRHARVLGREYLTMAHLSDEEEMRLWRTNRDFWAQLGASYFGCLSETVEEPGDDPVRRLELARLIVRLLRAYGARLKWDQFRYWPASEAVWQIMGRAYLYAERNGFSRREVAAYHGERQLSTVEQEYLRSVVFYISSLDSLLPFEIEIAERIIAFFLPRYALSGVFSEGYAHWVDPEQRRTPGRISDGVEPTPTLRYVSTSEGVEGLRELGAALEQGHMPPHPDLARYRSPRIVLPVVRHLESYWAAEQPKRQFDRHRVRSQMAVVAGLANICQSIGKPEEAPAYSLWSVEDVSQGGIRARLSLADKDQLPIGTVLGMRPEGGDNWLVGIVRRFARESGEQAGAGIQTLSKHSVVVHLGNGDEPRSALLLDAPDEGERVRLLLPGLAFQADDLLTCRLAGEHLTLRPIELIERGVEFDLAAYSILPRR